MPDMREMEKIVPGGMVMDPFEWLAGRLKVDRGLLMKIYREYIPQEAEEKLREVAEGDEDLFNALVVHEATEAYFIYMHTGRILEYDTMIYSPEFHRDVSYAHELAVPITHEYAIAALNRPDLIKTLDELLIGW